MFSCTTGMTQTPQVPWHISFTKTVSPGATGIRVEADNTRTRFEQCMTVAVNHVDCLVVECTYVLSVHMC